MICVVVAGVAVALFVEVFKYLLCCPLLSAVILCSVSSVS